MSATLDMAECLFSENGITVPIRFKWACMLAALAEGRGRRNDMLRALYPSVIDEPESAEKCVQVQISLLRSALRRAGIPSLIASRYGAGYALKRPVTLVNHAPSLAIPAHLADDLRRILYSSRVPAADRILAAIG